MTEEEVKAIAAQLRHPDGELGLQVAGVMLESNISMIRCAMQALELKPHSRVLELGHGNGGHLCELFDCASGLRYAGLELSNLMHESAILFAKENRLDQNCNFKVYDGLNLPYPDAAFDSLFTVNTLYFWPDPLKMLQEIFRVLKPGGAAAVCFGRKSYMINLPFTRYNFRLYEPEEVISMAEDCGFCLSGLIEKREPVRGKTGETVERDFVCTVLKR